MKNGTPRRPVYSRYDDEKSFAMSILPNTRRKMRVRKLLLILLYAAWIAGWGVLLTFLQAYVMPLATFSLLSLLVLIFYTWRYAKVEYELSIHEGRLEIAVIYGGLSRRELFSGAIRELEEIGFYDGAGRARAENFAATEVIVCVSDPDSPDNCYALRRTAEGKRTLLVFATGGNAVKLLKYYHSAAFRS